MKRSRLDLHLQKASLPDDVDRGAVARVIPIGGKKQAKQQQIVIPAGRGKKVASVNVAPGKYVIETRTPAGALIRQSIDVAEHETTKSVALDAGQSGNSWMAMQAPAEINSLKAPKPGTGKISVHALAVDRMRADTWDRLGDLGRSGKLPTIDDVRTAFGAALPIDVAPAERSGGIETFLWEEDYGLPQTIIVVERPNTLELLPIPLPWTTQQAARACVECAVPAEPNALLRCTVRDPDFGAVLAHLVAGSLSDARQLMETDLMRWLDEKRENPYAAALGACVLVKTESSGKRQEWDPWIDNLATWFPGIPDGPALQGMRRLKLARTKKDLAGVRASFIEALRRGVPVFAPVAAMLLEGVSMLVRDESFDAGELDDRLPAVRAVMLRMQSGHAFTVLRFETQRRAA